MKLALVLAILAFALCSHATSSAHELKKYLEMHHKIFDEHSRNFQAMHRAFASQQAQFLTPVSDDPICQETDFVPSLIRIFTLCTVTYVNPVSNVSTFAPSGGITTAKLQTYWGDFCTSPCNTESAAFIAKFFVCLHPVIKQGVASTQAVCSRDSNGRYCGVTLSAMNTAPAGCALYNLDLVNGITNCQASSVYCTVQSVGSARVCRPSYSNDFLSVVCAGDCLTNYINTALKPFPAVIDVASQVRGIRSMCLRGPSGGYCIPTASALAEKFGDNMDQSTLSTICDVSGDTYFCLNALIATGQNAEASAARRNFLNCAIFTCRNDTTCINSGSSLIGNSRSCLERFLESQKEQAEISSLMPILCTKNAEGRFCAQYTAGFETDLCFGTALGAGTCSSACRTSIAANFTSWGCCAGLFQYVMTRPENREAMLAELPYVRGYSGPPASTASPRTMAPVPATTAPVTVGSGEMLVPVVTGGGLYSVAAACEVSDAVNTLRKMCTVQTFTVDKSLLLNLVYEEVAANPGRRARFLASLVRDAAEAARVAPALIQNPNIEAAASVRVPVASASRRQSSGASTATGTKFTFQITGADRASVTAASQSVDQQTSSGVLPMTNTAATATEECSTSCAGTQGVSGISSVQSGTSTSSGSNLRGALTFAAVAVTTILLLL